MELIENRVRRNDHTLWSTYNSGSKIHNGTSFCAQDLKLYKGYDNVWVAVKLNEIKYEHMTNFDYVNNVVEYINELGFDVKLLSNEPIKID